MFIAAHFPIFSTHWPKPQNKVRPFYFPLFFKKWNPLAIPGNHYPRWLRRFPQN